VSAPYTGAHRVVKASCDRELDDARYLPGHRRGRVVVVRIDGSWGRHFDAWLSRLPAAALVLAGLVIVAGLGWMDFVTGPELTPLVFYLVPVVLVAWYAGRWPGAIVACAGGLAWMLADAVTHGEYSHWSIPYWN